MGDGDAIGLVGGLIGEAIDNNVGVEGRRLKLDDDGWTETTSATSMTASVSSVSSFS